MTTWINYIGAQSYAPTAKQAKQGVTLADKFLTEAKKFGVSRRTAPNAVKGMEFGDTVLLVDWRGGKPAVFGEYIVKGVIFKPEVADRVKQMLSDEGKAPQCGDGGGVVQVERECGSYGMGGGCTVTSDTTMGELMEKANAAERAEAESQGIAKNDAGTAWMMVQGYVSKTYLPPRTLEAGEGAALKFKQGFLRLPEGLSFNSAYSAEQTVPDGAPSMYHAEEYQKA